VDPEDQRDDPQGLSRRSLLRGVTGALLAPRLATALADGHDETPPPKAGNGRFAVVGAGAFGAFTALALRRGGGAVTLLDTWGPGNSRASSGGDTRVIRGVYADRVYVELAARAFELWREIEGLARRRFYHPTGAIWLLSGGEDLDRFLRTAASHLTALGFPFEELTAAEAAKRFPQVSFDGVKRVLREERAGYLLARQACAAAVELFTGLGGEYRQIEARPGAIAAGALDGLRLADSSTLRADTYVFACGPWLGKLFPDVLGERIAPTRQEVFFFGTPAGDSRFDEGNLPVWVDLGERLFYGIPGGDRRGFKVADDTRGEPFDPTGGERLASAEALREARRLLAWRFPALKDAPLLESRVCQYENTPDLHFVLDRHPAAENVWLVGGGSGHGFKFAPAWGEQAAATVIGRRTVDPFFGLARFEKRAARSSTTELVSA
jgi:glycine/D-amino acid oxidase-like deaminating enzyme